MSVGRSVLRALAALGITVTVGLAATGTALAAPVPVTATAASSGAAAELARPAAAPAAGDSGSAGPEATALVQAASTGQPVEVLQRRTATQQVFANPSGSLTLEVSAEPRWVRRPAGWVPVDTTLERRPDGSVTPRAAVLDQTFSGGGSLAPLVRLGQPGSSLALAAPFTLPSPAISGSRATYAEVLPGVDLVVTAGADSFSQVLVVKSRAAAAQPALASLHFPVSAQGLALQETPGGGLEAVDRIGRPVLSSPEPLMWDSASKAPGSTGGPSTGGGPITGGNSTTDDDGEEVPPDATGGGSAATQGPAEGSTVEAMDAEVSATGLSVTPDQDMLADPGTVYPVYIDPTFAASRTGWAMVNATYPDQEYWKFGGDEGVGYNTTNGTHKKRLFYAFSTGALAGKTITKATFRAFETFAYSCTKTEVGVWRTGSISSKTNWNNQPKTVGSRLDTATVAYGRDGCSPGGAWVAFDVKAGVAATAAAKASSTTFGLRASSESSNSGWKRFRKDATLSVDYNTPPAKPTSLRTTDPTTSCATGASRPVIAGGNPPNLVAKLADADGSDGQQVSARFELWKSGGSAAAHAYNTSAKSIPKDSGDFSYSAVPALADGVWKWRVQARDGIATSAWAGWCEFTVDSKKPESAPTITAATGNTYAVGAQPVFTLGPGTATGVTRYAYSLNGGTKVTTTATLTLPPLRYFGPNRLTVYSYDAAGNQSDPTDYVGAEGDDTFLVTGTTLPRDRWKADEGTGTAVGDLRPSGATYDEPWTVVAANALTLANGTAWGAGRRSAADTGEHVLTFDGVDDRGVGTATKVVDVSANWSVVAWLRPGARAARQVAVSEDSTGGSAFALGTVAKQETDPDDGTTVTSQFFSVSLDHPSTSGADAVCDSDVALEPGDWYSVAVAYSAPLQELTVRVVAEGTNDEVTCEVPFTPASTAGVLRIGHAVTGGSATAHWLGEIDEIQAFEGTVDPGIHDTRRSDPR